MPTVFRNSTLHLFFLFVLCLPCLAPSPACGQPAPGFARLSAPVTASYQSDESCLLLADGRRLRLMGIELPRQEPGGRQAALQDLATSAERELTTLLQSGPVTLWEQNDAEEDRWGRLPVLVTTADGRLIQGELLRQGLARVMPAREDEAALSLLLAAEEPARTAKLGLWGHPRYALRHPDETTRLIDTSQVVQGRITSVNATKNAIYLNLGDDKRRNLGIRIAKRLARAFPSAPSDWAGREIRVRGFIGKSIGPLIDIWLPGQIELLPDSVR